VVKIFHKRIIVFSDWSMTDKSIPFANDSWTFLGGGGKGGGGSSRIQGLEMFKWSEKIETN